MGDENVETPVVETEPVPAEPEVQRPPCVDLTDFKLKIDHFDQMHALGEENKVEGAPNFRKVSGFPVYGTAQPTEQAYEKIMELVLNGGKEEAEKAKVAEKVEVAEKPEGTENTEGAEEVEEAEKAEEGVSLIWYNMRQEPVIYLNGIPYAPRHPDCMHENLELDNPVPELDDLQKSFVEMLRQRADSSPDNTLKVYKDSAYTENPMERENVEESIKPGSLKGLNDVFKDLKVKNQHLKIVRVPVVEERAPCEEYFDTLVNSLKHERASAQCVFSCQMGRGRTTLGMIVVCLIKEIKISTELRKMTEIGLVEKATIDNIIKQKFESPLPKNQDDADPFIMGEFDVIKELLEKVPEAVEGKRKIDRVIDICGPSPKGNGLQNLRECIIETKWKYDVAPEEKQVVWKRMILNFMERYFYLILFSTYATEVGPDGFKSSFKEWMDKRAHLRTMIEEGKDKLEWYRQVDPQKLNTLKELINAPNYKENLATLIKTIYEFAFLTYADLPRGPIKNNSMRKLAAKTLMEILPPEVGQEIQKKMGEHTTSPDFVTLIGLVSYHSKNEEGATTASV